MASFLSQIQSLRDWLTELQSLADPCHPLGAEARRCLPETTGLSPEGVDWALSNSLELEASDTELAELCARVTPCGRAHVLLSANLFVAPLRAIAIAKAASARVFVRPSRREPWFTEFLHRAAPNSFELVEQLAPSPDDHVWAYGSDETMQSLVNQWPRGVVLHAHGDGYGALAVEPAFGLSAAEYDAMAIDVAAFEQRGCLSPRVVVVTGSQNDALTVAKGLFSALVRLATTLPLGRRTNAEQVATLRHRELYRFVGQSFEAPGCLVTVDAESPSWTVPPSGRVVHVTWSDCLEGCLTAHARELTSVGASTPVIELLQRALPLARVVPYGSMQRPPLDGPVDRRVAPQGIVL